MTVVICLIVVAAHVALTVAANLSLPAEAMAVLEIEIALSEAERLEESFAIPFAVANVGDSGAHDVSVRFEVTPHEGGDPVEDVTIIIDILPPRGIEEGLVLVSHDPATHSITGWVEAYLLP